MSDECPRFYGKHRGKVTNTLDPMGLGRVEVSVADIFSDGSTGWAMPCLPGAGPGVGLFAIPPVGAKCGSNLNGVTRTTPFGSGGFWDVGDPPASMGPLQPFTRVWAGENFRIEILDVSMATELTLSVTTAAGEAMIKAGADAMQLSFAGSSIKIAIDGVSINGTNLKVLP